ncbi:MAG: M20 family peptidase [Candidatus Hydrogenedentes bacterium]|nr:M20 family peptidase [Candidatus Hydrogenedentota bacterium]
MKKVLSAVALLVLLLSGVVLYRGVTFESVQVPSTSMGPISVEVPRAAEHLAESLRFETISYGVQAPLSKDAFESFHAYLETTYPNIHGTLDLEVAGGFSLLYTWRGSDPALRPLLIMGHFDVVPVPPDTLADWEHPPFAGEIVDGVIWGRGALDDKVNVIGAMEAVEWMIGEGFQPRRTLYLAFGHDEEVGGAQGAVKIAALLKGRGVELECVVDEGGSIIADTMPGVEAPVALIGIAEKGYLTLTLSVEQSGGHSSMPPNQSAIGILAAAVARLEANPFPAKLGGPSVEMFAAFGPEMPFAQRVVFANLWLTKPLVMRLLSQSPETNAMLRTTTAVTMMNGGVKDNVLPTEASASVNFRIMPGETTESVVGRVREVVNDERVRIEAADKSSHEPSIVSDTDAPAFGTLEKTIRQVCPDVLVGPYLVLGATDARHYEILTPNIYRFTPIRLGKGDTAMLHGANERIRVDNFGEVCRFYVQLIRNFNS